MRRTRAKPVSAAPQHAIKRLQRQAHDIAVRAFDGRDEKGAALLDAVRARGSAPFARGQVPLDLIVRELAKANPRRREPHVDGICISRVESEAAVHAVDAAGERLQKAARFVRAGRLAQRGVLNVDERVAAENPSQVAAGRKDRARLALREREHLVRERRRQIVLLVDAGVARAEGHSDPSQELLPAGRGGCEQNGLHHSRRARKAAAPPPRKLPGLTRMVRATT